MKSLIFIITTYIMCLSACGFTPLYTSQETLKITEETAQIEILPIPNYYGFLISNNLNDRLNPEKKNVSKIYNLSVQLNPIIYEDQMIQENNLSTNKKIIIRATYTLTNRKTGKVLIQTTTSVSGSYNILKSPYATVVDQDKNQIELIRILSNDIATHIITYFKQENSRESKTISD